MENKDDDDDILKVYEIDKQNVLYHQLHNRTDKTPETFCTGCHVLGTLRAYFR